MFKRGLVIFSIIVLFLFLLNPVNVKLTDVSAPMLKDISKFQLVASAEEGFGVSDVSAYMSNGRLKVIASTGQRGTLYAVDSNGYTQLTGTSVNPIPPLSTRTFQEGYFPQTVFYSARMGSYNSGQNRLAIADRTFGARMLHLSANPQIANSLLSPSSIPALPLNDRFTAIDVVQNSYPNYYAFERLANGQTRLVSFEPNTGVMTVIGTMNWNSPIDGSFGVATENYDVAGMDIVEGPNGAEKIIYVTGDRLRIIDLTQNPPSVNTLTTASAVVATINPSSSYANLPFTDVVYDGVDSVYIVGTVTFSPQQTVRKSFIVKYNLLTSQITPILVTNPGNFFGSFSDSRTEFTPLGIDKHPTDSSKLILAANGYVAVADLTAQTLSHVTGVAPTIGIAHDLFLTTYRQDSSSQPNYVGVYAYFPSYSMTQYLGQVGPIPLMVGTSPSAAVIKDVNGDGRKDIIVGIPSQDQVFVYDGFTLSLIGTITGTMGSGFGTRVFASPNINALDGATRLLVVDANNIVSSWKSTPAQNGQIGATLENYLMPPPSATPLTTSKFGNSLDACVTGNSRWFAVGAPGVNNGGAVYIYNVNAPSALPFQINLGQMGSNALTYYSEFGTSVAFTDNCNLLIGAPGVGTGISQSLLTESQNPFGYPTPASSAYAGPNPYPVSSTTELNKRSGAVYEISLTSTGQFASVVKKIDGKDIYQTLYGSLFPALTFSILTNWYVPPIGYYAVFSEADALKLARTSQEINARVGQNVAYLSGYGPNTRRAIFASGWGTKQDATITRKRVASSVYGLPGSLFLIAAPVCSPFVCWYTELPYVANIIPRYDGILSTFDSAWFPTGNLQGQNYIFASTSYNPGTSPNNAATLNADDNYYYPENRDLLEDIAQLSPTMTIVFEKETNTFVTSTGLRMGQTSSQELGTISSIVGAYQ
ncbi:MAG: hypothetical protein ACP5NS_04355 [Candidatus Pacearchaeota archaeon]